MKIEITKKLFFHRLIDSLDQLDLSFVRFIYIFHNLPKFAATPAKYIEIP